ncbi:MAG TPA: phosphoglycerate dehydrogenase [Bryobacteraceae bacterium]|jgi:D-3-phosphoglycerate dehydrogenase|nr:phosphoglycerate dehydrogenase [Bryobacteraceae bacterium]
MIVLVAEPLADVAVALLKSQPGWNVIVSSPKEYSNHLAEADALIVRSAVQVNQSVLDKAPRLRVIGRAGVGVDNVDLEAATAAGVLVMNTPGGNAISVAEHTLALMLAMARHIPEATQSTTGGKWEKKKFMGSELRGKSLGIVGLGSIGREVVKRARAFEMHVQAYDPYVTAQIAKDLGVELVDLAALYAHSDYITLHVALTPETDRMLSHDAFAQMKPGVRIVNCARGELVDEEALRQAIDSGKVGSAALDVFSVEPPPSGFPLFAGSAGHNILATPHIAGSTEEAQEIVGVRIAEQVVEYLTHGVALNAVNMPSLSPDQYRALGPYINVAERLGSFAAYIAAGHIKTVRLAYFGRIGENNTSLLRNAGLAGVLKRSMSERANLVNAMQIAGQRGWNLDERHESRSGHTDSIRLELETDSGVTVVEGAVLLGNPRLIQVDGIYCEAPLSGHLIFMKNLDVPGVIGHVGMVLGHNNINIANFSLGRGEVPAAPGQPLEAVAVVSTDGVVPERVLQQLLENPAVKLARSVEFG